MEGVVECPACGERLVAPHPGPCPVCGTVLDATPVRPWPHVSVDSLSRVLTAVVVVYAVILAAAVLAYNFG